MGDRWFMRVEGSLSAHFNIPNRPSAPGVHWAIRLSKGEEAYKVLVKALFADDATPETQSDHEYQAQVVMQYLNDRLNTGWHPTQEMEHTIYLSNPTGTQRDEQASEAKATHTRCRIPLLPLPDTTVFPSTIQVLYLERGKSIQALERSMASNKEILLATRKSTATKDPGVDDIYRVGTISAIVTVIPLTDQMVKVIVEGLRRAKIIDYVQTEDFFLVESENIDERASTTGGIENETLTGAVKMAFDTYLHLKGEIDYLRLKQKNPPKELPSIRTNIELRIRELLQLVATIKNESTFADTLVAQMVNLTIHDRQRLLEQLDPRQRLEEIHHYLQSGIESMRADLSEASEQEPCAAAAIANQSAPPSVAHSAPEPAPDVPHAIAAVLKKERQVSISHLGKFQLHISPTQRQSVAQSSDESGMSERAQVMFLPSQKLKALLSAGQGSSAAKRFELDIAAGTLTFECAQSVAKELLVSDGEAQGAIRSWLASLISQLLSLKTGSRIAVPPLGFFQIRKYAEFAGINPKTKQPIPVPPRVLLFFLSSTRLRAELMTQSIPEEVSHNEFSSIAGPILTLKDYGPEAILQLVPQISGHAPGISWQDVERIESLAKTSLPALLKQLLLRFSTNHPPFMGLSKVASSPEAFASLIDRYSKMDTSIPSAIPFAEESSTGEAAWFFCACPKCSEDPQVFVAQQLGSNSHSDSEDSLRLSRWIASRVLLHKVLTACCGRVLRYDDALSLLEYFAPLEANEGVHPELPV